MCHLPSDSAERRSWYDIAFLSLRISTCDFVCSMRCNECRYYSYEIDDNDREQEDNEGDDTEV